jgi:hypothetical protein
MTFVNLSLLAGAALVAVPIVLHLIMRQRPTLLEFPALRFIQKRLDVNRRRLQLRHLLLLLLRAAIIALLAFALARPSVRFGGALGSQEAPVAAAMVFDAAPRMEYRHENQTRLESVRNMGLWLLTQLPDESEVGVIDTRLGTAAAFQADRGAAKDRIARLETVANSQPLPAAIENAVKLLRTSKLERKELYVFTDLSRGGWPEDKSAQIGQLFGEVGTIGVYVIDVGVAKPTDYGLGEVRLSGEVLSSRSPLGIETQLTCIGATASRTIELHVWGADGKPQKRSERQYEAAPGELQPVEFRLGGLGRGTHQGFVRIAGQDGLAADDTRYFTVSVNPAFRVLIAAPKPAESNAFIFTQALAPEQSRKRGDARFDCDVCDFGELGKKTLSDYAAVFLLDPTPLEPAVWKALADYAAEGHGVGIFLGRNAQPIDAMNTAPAQSLLSGKLISKVERPDGDLRLAPRDDQHPIFSLAAFRVRQDSIPWDAFPVLKYWGLSTAKPQADNQADRGASVVLAYNDGAPAILERPIGRGRALTMTTPISDRPNRTDGPWNLLLSSDSWPFMILANQIATYLAGSSERQWNYLAGQTAVLQLDASAKHRSYLLSTPGGLGYPVTPDLKRHELAVTATDQVGNYRVQAGGSKGVDLGFSVNYAPDQTRLDRLSDKELAGLFGPVKYQLARTREQLDRNMSVGRVGRELFPLLIVIVAVILGLEMLVSNRFYRE